MAEKTTFCYADPGNGNYASGSSMRVYRVANCSSKYSRTGVAISLGNEAFDGRWLTSWEQHFCDRTGIAQYQLRDKADWILDAWFQFDIYTYEGNVIVLGSHANGEEWTYDTGTVGGHYKDFVWLTIKCSSSPLDEGLSLSTGDQYTGGKEWSPLSVSLVGFHTIKLHVISHETNGLVALYADNDDTPFYTYTGNVCKGYDISEMIIRYAQRGVDGKYHFDITDGGVLENPPWLSNIIYSYDKPSVSDIVPCDDLPFQESVYASVKVNDLSAPQNWRYENPGTTDGEFAVQWGESQTVEDSSISHTHTALVNVGHDYLLPMGCVASTNEIWVKFDFCFALEGEYATQYTPYVDFFVTGGSDAYSMVGVSIGDKSKPNAIDVNMQVLTCDGSVYVEERDSNEDQYFEETRQKISSKKIHTALLHIKDDGTYGKHGTDGVWELYIDDDTEPLYRYTGDVWIGQWHPENNWGDPRLDISASGDGIFVSNIIFSNQPVCFNDVAKTKPVYFSINREVLYQPVVWRYISPCITDDFGGQLVDVYDNNVSRTGVAVAIEDSEESDGATYSLYNKTPIYGKKEGEAWVKFDACTIDERAYLWFGFGNGDAYGAGCFTIDWHSDDSASCTLHCNGDDVTDERSISRGIIHTFRLHVKRTEDEALYEVYIDNDNVPTYQQHDSVNEYDVFYNFEFQMSGVAISNFIIGNVKMSANETLSYYVPPSFYYENPGKYDGWNVRDDTDVIVTTDDSVSRTGTAIYNDWTKDQGYGNIQIGTFDVKGIELWAKMDVYIPSDYNGSSVIFIFIYSDQYTGVYLYKNYVDIYVANDEDDCKTDREEKKACSLGTTPGLHTVKMHAITHKEHGLFEVFIDDDSTPFYTYTGNVANGHLFNYDGSCSVQLYSDNAIMSNLVISSSDIPMDYVVSFDAPRFYYENPGIDDGKIKSNLSVQEIHDDTVSRTGTAIKAEDTYSLEYPISVWDETLREFVPRFDNRSEFWIKFDAYFYDYDAFDDDGVLSDESYDHTGIWFGCMGDGEGADVLIEWTSLTSANIKLQVETYTEVQQGTRDMSRGLHSFKMRYKATSDDTLVELYIDDDETASYSYHRDSSISMASNIQWALYNCVISNITIGASDVPMSYVVGQSDGTIHADIIRNVTGLGEFSWYYKNVGVIADFSEGTILKEINDSSVSHTGVGVTYDENQTGCSNSYITIPSEVSDELWVKFDVYCPTKDGWVYTEYGTGREGVLYHSEMPSFNCRYAYDNHYGTGMQVYCSNYQMLDDAKANEMFRVELADPDRIEKMKRLPFFGFHTVKYHIVSDVAYGLFEVFVDDETTPYYKYTGKVCGGHKLGDDNGRIEFVLSDVVVSNIIISTEYIGMNEMANTTEAHADISREVKKVSQGEDTPQPEPIVYEATAHADISREVIGQKELPKEGVATHQPIDLGSELTVGIGIVLDGEGYAMIRTAGEDERYTEWESYVPCERTCRYIDVRLHVLGIITSAMLTIDKRTVSKTISKHLTAGENVVNYDEAFYNVPAVIPTAIGDGVVAHVISKDKTSCVIKITDGNNNAVEGDVDILIRGW